MAKGGGFVSFDKKVAEPSERVDGNRRAKQPPCIPRYSRDDDEQKDNTRSDKMPPPRRSFAVLGQIERPKFFIVAESHFPHPLSLPPLQPAAREWAERAAPGHVPKQHERQSCPPLSFDERLLPIIELIDAALDDRRRRSGRIEAANRSVNGRHANKERDDDQPSPSIAASSTIAY